MGKGGKKQTIGYKYYLGMHLGLCHGPIDAITRLRCDDRDAWFGENTGGSINVNAPELFGGEKREGGVSGVVDVEMGGPTQGQNSYLVSKLGSLIPAFRGIVGLVFRQAYLGNNPYLKQWAARGTRIHVRQDGIEQWYDDVAEISPDLAKFGGLWEYQLLPYHANPGTTNLDIPTTGWDNAAPLPYGDSVWLRSPDLSVIWIRKTIFNVPAGLIIQARADNGCLLWVNGTYIGGSNIPNANISNNNRFPVEFLVPGSGTYEIVVKAYTESSSGAQGGNYLNITLANQVNPDMNPAHIVRECLTDPEWGMGYTDADIDDDSFMAAADIFYAEGLGLSLLWDKQIKIDEFVQTVLRHVDTALYVSRTTGKFVLKPIRGGYDEGDLLSLDESNIVSVDDPTRIAFGELTNSVTVTYWDAITGKDATITVTDPALVQQQGVIINAPLQYPGFTNGRNATVAAQRDLKVLSSPLLSCTITADSDAKVLNIGDVFKFSWAKWGLVDVVMRVTGISYGTGRNKRVKINCTEDVFDTDTNVVVVVPGSDWTDPSAPPSAVAEQIATEAPYWELVQALGQADTDNKLLTHPEIGYVIGAGSRPASAINASLFTDDGAGYEDVGALDFAPIGYLTTDITKTQTTFALEDFADLGEVAIGSHVQIGEELMRVDVLDDVTGAIEVGRGVLDTVPQEHFAGDFAMFWDAYAGFDPTEYVVSEEVGVKIVPVSGAGVLPLAEAVEMTVELAQRAARPYAPGDLRINGESYEPDPFYAGEVEVTWTDRDRLQQTSGSLVDHTAGNIGPEAGTEYRLRVYVDEVLDQTIEPAVSPQAVTPGSAGFVRVEVHSKRDELYSWQAPSHTFRNAAFRLTEDGDDRYTEDGDIRIIED